MKIIVNLYGGPGAGKSTAASGLFYKLKANNYKCELVTEYAKELVYEDRVEFLNNNQLNIFTEQYSRVERLKNKVDIVITDSPILLSLVYMNTPFNDELKNLVVKANETHFCQNLNFYIKRNPDTYKEYGRTQSLSEAEKLDERIIKEVFPYAHKGSMFPMTIITDKDRNEVVNKLYKAVQKCLHGDFDD